MTNETLENLKTRRSIRKYKNTQIPDDLLNAILEAGTYAACGMGKQASMMAVVQNPELVAKISKMNGEIMGTDTDPFYGAPTVIVVFSDTKCPTHVEDGSLVMGNLMNAAHAVGIDSCWIHRAKEVFETEEGKKLKKEWGIPEDYIGVGNCILGYRDCEYPKAAPRKEDYIVKIGK